MTTLALVLIAVTAALVLWLAVELFRLKRRVEVVPEEGGVYEGLRRLDEDLATVEELVSDFKPRLEAIEAILPTAIRHTGVVAYDAFGDVSGRLSRSMALLDGNRNGVVISLIVGRNETRWFTKMIRGGAGHEPLSPEEEAAIREALAG